MSEIKAFCALRPAAGYADQVAALPYDVMNSGEARQIAGDKPYSFLRVDKAEIDLDENTDPYDPAVYKKAGENLRSLIENHILEQDKAPALYIYRLTMGGREQTGLVACASVDEYLENRIKKHELTLERKERDRILHVEACEAQTGPIFLAYRGRDDINALIEGWKSAHSPVYDFTADDGVSHTVWIIGEESAMSGIIAGFEKVPALYIADGHHRNASAVKAALRRRRENPNYNGAEEFNYYLSVIFPAEQLAILPYNRVVRDLNGLSDQDFLDRASARFDAAPVKGPFAPEEKGTFGLYLSRQWYKLTPRKNLTPGGNAVDRLDVSVLQKYILSPILGIGDVRQDSRIDFIGGIRGPGELERLVNSGGYSAAFSMYPTSIEELMSIADSGLIMPPKSTWFEPKLRSGLFVHLI
ncbi:MAG: DUF1015 family protein [Oscillospiraceae bacterium]|jgi:uncharacterized protein (DUF1015 family)|nr:DUF1015 family protein [Oscillospiraceae bacterium]